MRSGEKTLGKRSVFDLLWQAKPQPVDTRAHPIIPILYQSVFSTLTLSYLLAPFP